MEDMFEFSSNIQRLPQLLDAAELRHRVISHNLANVNTPGYTRQDVKFEEQLAQAIKSRSDLASKVTPEVADDNSASMRADGNNVDIDREIGQMNKNAILAQMYSQVLRTQFDTMRRAVEAP